MDPKLPSREGSSTACQPQHVELSPATRRRLQALDRDAMAEFYDAWFARIYAFVRRMVVRDHLAEDLTQDIFIQLQQTFSSYDPARPLQPWVFTIATNKVRDFWRSRRHNQMRREVTLDDEARSGLAVAPNASPAQPLESLELEAQLRAAIEELPDSMRVALELRYFQGLSFAAIGEIVDRNETAVRKRYSRALEELRSVLGGVLGPGGEERS